MTAKIVLVLALLVANASSVALKSRAAEQGNVAPIHSASSVPPPTEDIRSMVCKTNGQEGTSFWDKYDLVTTQPDPEAYKLWQGLWIYFGQPKEGSWNGGFTIRGEIKASGDGKTLIIRGARSECVGCTFNAPPVANYVVRFQVVDKFLVTTGARNVNNPTVYWYEKREGKLYLYGAHKEWFGGQCLERKGERLQPPA